MKRFVRYRVLTIAVLILSGGLSVLDQGSSDPTSESISSLTTTDRIEIDGNDEFATMASSEGWSGSGSLSDPYIIEGYLVDAEGERHCIRIDNTDVHFVIRDCQLIGTSNYTN
ncbi:MAG: hypothetical protein ACMUHY_09850, partial [Thermoplasmatota archaeon]